MMKKLVLFFEGFMWNIRCAYGQWLHGGYGLAKVVEKMPFYFIIPYLRKYGATIGEGCRIERGINIHRPFGINKPFENLYIGDNVYLGHEVLIDLTCQVVFKDASSAGSGVQLWTHASAYIGNTIHNAQYIEHKGAIVIDEGTFVFSDTVIKHGVHLGKFSNIGANSFCNKDVADFSHASGVPVRVIKRNANQNI